MRVTIFGLGYVGSVTAACLASAGNEVVGIDSNPTKVDALQEGRAPTVEPGLDDLIATGVREGRLRATTDAREGLRDAEVVLLCVGTPSLPNGDVDLRFVERVCDELAENLDVAAEWPVVAIRSTVPPGSIERVVAPRLRGPGVPRADIAMCPEFLREGTGVRDFLEPPLTVIGTDSPAAGRRLADLLAFVDRDPHVVDVTTAEALKYACNAFHGLKVVFANEIARWCQALGSDPRDVMRLFCEDDQLNLSKAYLRPGFSFGGSCLPKDLRSLLYQARRGDVDLPVLSQVLASNGTQLDRAVQLVLDQGADPVAIMGLSFKGGTDDLRESPCVELAERLIGKGMTVRIYDPHVNPSQLRGANREYMEQHLPHLERLLCNDAVEAVRDCAVAVVTTKDPDAVAALCAHPPQLLLDAHGDLGEDVEKLTGYRGLVW